MRRRPDPRPWLDRGYVCYPLAIAACLALWYLLAGCAASQPRQVEITWTNSCRPTPQVKRIKIVDTQRPAIDCILAAPADQKVGWTALLMVGVPISACAIPADDHAVIYAALSPGPGQALATVGALMSPSAQIEHEIDHVFGRMHPLLAPWLEYCQ